MGEIQDGGTASEAEIVTKNNTLVDKLLVVKGTGRMRSVY